MAKPDWKCGAARELPIDLDRAWDGPAAAQRVLRAAGFDDGKPKPEQARRGFLAYDAGSPKLKGSYKLPFCDLVDGTLTCLASGIRAAASRLPQTDIPDAERNRARAVVEHYEQRIEKMRRKERGAHVGGAAVGAECGFAESGRLVNTPLAIFPGATGPLVARVTEALRNGGRAVVSVSAVVPPGVDGYSVMDGIGIVPVRGLLFQRAPAWARDFGITGLDSLRQALAQCFADPAVKALALDVDSPGGEVAGCFDLVDELRAMRGAGKPVWAILNECAYSAAYALASAADRVVVPRTGGTGSIGVISLVADLSKLLDGAGVKINVIQFGARKGDGLSALPLSPEARDRFQADVDAIGELFCETVAQNRGLRASVVRAMEAGTYLGPAGVKAGLADQVASPAAAFAQLSAAIR